MMMTTGPDASARQQICVSALVGAAILAAASPWNPMPRIGVAGAMSDQPAGSIGATPFLVKQATRGAGYRKNVAFIQLRKPF